MDQTPDEHVRFFKRLFLTIVLTPFLVAIWMTVVDSYRRRGKRSRPFPTVEPETVDLGTHDGSVTVYTYGQDLYDAMLAAIDSAREEIFFETYIWKADEVGDVFKRALVNAAERGVRVHVIYDVFANLVVSPRFKKFPSNIQVLRFPIYTAGWRMLDFRHYGRDHRKILTVDEQVAFVGGYNIGGEYATQWRDTHVAVTGPAVRELRRAFADFWNLHRRNRLRPSAQALTVAPPENWDLPVRVVRNVPRLMMFPIRSMYLDVIDRAGERIWLTQAYFLPDQDFVDALVLAARRGVDVRLLVPLKSNHIVTDWISRGYYSQMLDAGIRILRYQGAMVHAKTATVDGRWTTVGTANIDRLSLSGNYEINLEIVDDELAALMERIFAVDESNSLALSSEEWEARDLHRKFTEYVLAPLRPLL
ncbi:phospholipase D-like domain-containing protein [Nocardioides yefusunii]|uniref:Phosphatidylserine/phosphatidylglycerophosphate/ cardiolipin synthase family protein n=1 Tax=Nocardioides yefusunii TaxID=2500546 RepID=A0ABW1R0V0_9ACTN|nr:phospholipase D-like domain-containing protein [Nocardioides yefusunii]